MPCLAYDAHLFVHIHVLLTYRSARGQKEEKKTPVDKNSNGAMLIYVFPSPLHYYPIGRSRAGYYKTRYGVAPESSIEPGLAPRDPRITLLQASWFEGKKCLDVGCNEGDLMLELVRRFRPRRMVGVDIDGYLVQRARVVSEKGLLACVQFFVSPKNRSSCCR